MSLIAPEFLRTKCTAVIEATRCKTCGVVVGYSSQPRFLCILESAHHCTGAMHPPAPVRLPKFLNVKTG